MLSTCSRTEFYLVSPSQIGAFEHDWLTPLRTVRLSTSILRVERMHYREIVSATSGRYSFRVTCGLNSAVLGDVRIPGQSKHAMVLAGETKTIDNPLQKVFALTLNTGKCAHPRTDIGVGTVFVGSVVANMLPSRCNPPYLDRSPRILTIVIREAFHTIACSNIRRRLGEVRYISRTPSRAGTMAAQFGVDVCPWTRLQETVAEVDFVVTVTRASEPLLMHRFPKSVDGSAPMHRPRHHSYQATTSWLHRAASGAHSRIVTHLPIPPQTCPLAAHRRRHARFHPL